MKLLVVSLFGAALILASCTPAEEPLFKEIPAEDSGIAFSNSLLESRELNILTYLYYYNGAGVSAGDYNGDGLPDLYFTSNQGADALYLNRGDFAFYDATVTSGIDNSSGWTTGVTHVDINNDGLLDLYICKVGNFKSLKGRNLLYVNQGNNADGIPMFAEMAEKFGLAVEGLSTQAAFFDYDLDGDLDCYLMKHSVFPNRNYGKGSRRNGFDPRAGDMLLKNEGEVFVDVSTEAGIFQGVTGYGLGLGISDLNNDGYPDIYVGNDFFENDYLYINQKDGTFKEQISVDNTRLGHTTHYSMGNDLADLNNDGLIDIVAVDMLPEDLVTYKTSSLEYPYPIYQNYLRNGYDPQYMQNTLHLNLGNTAFSEVAHLAGISATEWSWAPLLADFDNDGLKDLFVSNGIKGATNDMDFINFIANEEIQKQLNEGMTEKEMSFISKMPSKKVPNFLFKNTDGLRFKNMTREWTAGDPSYSHGSTYVDLDNDGDLDLVINNSDAPASILNNTLPKTDTTNYIKLSFKGPEKNKFGVGVKVMAFSGESVFTAQNFVTRGYLSAVSPEVHLGLGAIKKLDSLTVVWPGGAFHTITDIPLNTTLVANINEANGYYYNNSPKPSQSLRNSDIALPFTHRDNTTLEFNRDPLIPYANSNEGPGIAVADINQDGMEDLYIGGGKGQAGSLLLQQPGAKFVSTQDTTFLQDAISDEVGSIFFNANGDDWPDLLIVSGGNEFLEGPALKPRLYLNNAGRFVKDEKAFSGVSINASQVLPLDFDADGDKDILITSDQLPLQFGQTPRHYLFENRNGNFVDVTQRKAEILLQLGQVRDAAWADLDGDNAEELVLVGPWMEITILKVNKSGFSSWEVSGLEATAGWWESIAIADMDGDGDLDMVVGNWGENSKLKASFEEPLTLYWADFDNNGTYDPLITYYHSGKETPFASKDELSKQLPFLNREFLSYSKFAKADLTELFSSKALKEANKKQLNTLASIYIENLGSGTFSWSPLPSIAQSAPITALYIDDFNKDGLNDVLAVGNRYEISTQLGRLDASHGLFLQNQKRNGLSWLKTPDLNIAGQARSLSSILIEGQKFYIVGMNNSAPVLLQNTIID